MGVLNDMNNLQTVVLYLSSAAAQVWAAIMVFGVLILRDSQRPGRDRVAQGWAKYNYIFGVVADALRNKAKEEDAQSVMEKLGPEPRNYKEFVDFMQAIKRTAVLQRFEIALGRPFEEGENQSPDWWQIVIGREAEALQRWRRHLGDTSVKVMMWIGLGAIIGNFCVLVLALCPDSYQSTLLAATISSFILNSAMLVVAGWKAKRALEF